MGGAAQCGIIIMESYWPHPRFTSSSPTALTHLWGNGGHQWRSSWRWGARRWAGHSLAAPDSLGQKVEQAHHLKQTEEQEESKEEKQRSHSGGARMGCVSQQNYKVGVAK